MSENSECVASLLEALDVLIYAFMQEQKTNIK